MAIIAYLLTVLCPECPAWCGLPPEHAPDFVDQADGSVTTIHRATVLADHPEGRRIDLSQAVTIEQDGTRGEDPPVIVLDGEPDNTLTPGQARRHAAALTLAADLAERAAELVGSAQ